MAIQNWRQYLTELIPAWLLGYFGERLTGAIGLLSDVVNTGAFEARVAPWVLMPTSPEDALPLVGSERGLPRLAGETATAYRVRLVDAWNIYKAIGSVAVLTSQFESMGLSDIEIKTNASANWDWDGQTDNWSRMWIVIKGHPWTWEGSWRSESTWGEPGTLGITASEAEVASLQDIVRRFRAAHDICLWIIIVIDPGSWVGEPAGDWDDWRNRDTGAAYLDGSMQAVSIRT